jgi:hypothetical protein
MRKKVIKYWQRIKIIHVNDNLARLRLSCINVQRRMILQLS